VAKLADHDNKIAAVYGDGKDKWAYLDLTSAWPTDKGNPLPNLDALTQWVKEQVQSELAA